MARAIVRCSLDKDKGSEVTNQIRKTLEQAGFKAIGTASYEASDLKQNDLTQALRGVLEILESAVGQTSSSLDHLWIYVDQGD